uniref:oxygen-dependent tRNA uridine(34) hydroxylase TrhO n=1 Tax=Roseimarinus sediminis TaxID=1610899 RepID=UPI003D1CE137
MFLYNRISKEDLKKRLMDETFKRKTISLYRYFYLDDPRQFRDEIYKAWDELNCFGRIYVAREGINAQMSVPEQNWELYLSSLNNWEIFRDIPIKTAIEDDGKSFYKLTIKVRPKLVADGLMDEEYDVTNVGKHLDAFDFHRLVDEGKAIVVDMRNHYESEVGHFKGALCPDADTFREEIRLVEKELETKKDHKILLYCTGGIRCEKASAYLREKGFSDVNQLHGGIIEYAQQIKKAGLKSNFIGKNFVFDERLGERISEDVIARCHQCGAPADTHTNCNNDDCHLLFIQCERCSIEYEGCCSEACVTIKNSSEEVRLVYRKKMHEQYSGSKIFRSRLRPDLQKIRKTEHEPLAHERSLNENAN